MDLLQNIGIGLATSGTSLFLIQPLYALKTAKQNRLALNYQPQILWSGYLSNTFGDSCNFSSQYVIYQHKTSIPINHAFLGGFIGGCIANLSEQFMDFHRQKKLQSFQATYLQSAKQIFQKFGFKTFTRGLPFTCIREISYNYTWSIGLEKTQKKIDNSISNFWISKGLASVLAGTALTFMNHPFDTLKSKIHNQQLVSNKDFLKNEIFHLKNHSVSQIFHEIYRGASFRIGIISLSLFLNEPLINIYSQIFKA